MTGPVVPPSPLDPAAVQAGIAETRAQLLGGRGSGASQAEIDRRTRGRSELAGEPTPQHLATVARQTAIARGDAAAIFLDIAATSEQLAGSMQAIRGRVSPSAVAGRQVRAIRETTATGWSALRATGRAGVVGAAGMALAVTGTVLLTRRRGHRRLPAGKRTRPGNRAGGPTRRR